MLGQWADKVGANPWGFAVLAYLQGDVTADALLAEATTSERHTQARFFIGMRLLFLKDEKLAVRQFAWIRDHGDKRSVFYNVALDEMKAIERSTVSLK